MNRYTYLNPDFMPNHVDEKEVSRTRASGLAYDVQALITTAQFAMENDTSGRPFDQRGIAQTLEIAATMACDLIDRCEGLERKLDKSTTGGLS